jgi:hypothetical protein
MDFSGIAILSLCRANGGASVFYRNAFYHVGDRLAKVRKAIENSRLYRLPIRLGLWLL